MKRCLLCLFLVVTACSANKGPKTFAVSMDARSPQGLNLQYSAFLPGVVKARPGDKIVFSNRSTQAPHTITFGVDAKRSNQPAVILPTGAENPVVRQPCYAEEPPNPALRECPFTDLPAYGGSGYWNSGFLAPAVAPTGRKRITLELSNAIKPGRYTFLCVLHGPMAGVLDVVANDSERDAPDTVVQAGEKQLARVRADAATIKRPELPPTGDKVGVVAGWGDATTAVNQFGPKVVSIRVGQTVLWESKSAFEPHTVSFGRKYQAGNPASGSFLPVGVASGSPFGGEETSSGIFGAAGGPFPPGPFSLTFSKPGQYTYVCLLHPGMAGIVRVT